MFARVWQLFIVLLILNISLIRCNKTLNTWTITGKISTVFATFGQQRPYMEDTHIRGELDYGIGVYAIFDGHSGGNSSMFAMKYLQRAIENELKIYKTDCERSLYTEGPDKKYNIEHMLTDLIDQVEVKLKSKDHKSGTTCLVVIAEEMKITVANVGDSRGVMCNSTGSAIDLSIDHKPNVEGEKRRIENAGERIYESPRGIWRVRGLSMSRSLGDNLKKRNDNVIIATPDIFTFDLDQHKPLFMILASDGLWDVLSSQAAVDFVKERYLSKPDFGAEDLVMEAIKLRSMDNITVIIVIFKNGRFEVRSANA